MSQDIVSDALNQIMNAKRIGKKEVEIRRISKLLINLFEMMKKTGYIDFEIKGDEKKPMVIVKILKLNECRAIKPRFNIGLRLKLGPITIHGDYTKANYSNVTAGLGISFR